jgi:hypothetical protein
MTPYYTCYETGRIKFFSKLLRGGRIRYPRLRAQKRYCRFSGIPFLPLRIEHYRNPKFYYSYLMSHRRKMELDFGISKLRAGLERLMSSNYVVDPN